jgi:hypothetical protein
MSTKTKPLFKVGSKVWILRGTRPVHAEIIEDRGRLGVGGRRLYRIRIPVTDDETIAFELPEEDIAADNAQVLAQSA